MKRTRKVLKAQVEPKIPERLPDAVCGSPSIDFAQISTHMLRNPNLSCKAKGLLCMLLSNRKGHWTSFSKGLEKLCVDGPDAIRTGLKELEEAGYLLRVNYVDIKTKRRRGSFWVYTHFSGYFQFEEHLRQLKRIGCEPQGGQTLPDFPDLENPIMGNPNLGNPRQIISINNNIKSKNNKKGFSEILDLFPDEWKKEESFHNNLKDYVQHRKEKGSSLTKVASSRLVNKLKQYSIQEASEALARSVENGWTGVFPESAKPSKSNQPHPNKLGHRSGAKFKVNAKVERMEQ